MSDEMDEHKMWELLDKISSDILLYNRTSNNNISKKETQKMYEESIQLSLKAGVLVMSKVDFDRWKSRCPSIQSLVKTFPGLQELVRICPDRNIIVSEYAGETLKQSVYGLIQKNKLSQLWTYDVAIQLTEAMQSMNSCGFLHNDLKPNNICVNTSSRKRPHVTIIDFGICTPLNGPPLLSRPMNKERRARNYWLAPEVT
ncbi:hypothetical protein Pmani_036232 [Petrolisthes manimaculis]|uniref:Protein kinase domain-containing protein n=1 Tax=Petrolisthes manimaculis TaxID=1843537 RepID=A0AAE1NIT9_9EUCA|nr:hypothetical protein Pmani_036232 [Petrolisthes manimaculis]